MSSNTKLNAALLFGGPGSGKGTQGVVLGGMPNLCHLAMGDIFRGLDKQSDIGKEFLSYSTKGFLVPDELTVRVWRKHVDGLASSGGVRADYHTLLLDGLPRTLAQVELMKQHVNVLAIVHLVIKDQQRLVERLKGRALKADRPDDADENVIRKRIEVYEAETAPVLGAYDTSLICEVNADQKPLEVLRDVADVLAARVPANI